MEAKRKENELSSGLASWRVGRRPVAFLKLPTES